MARYVIGPDTALRLAADVAALPAGMRLFAPTLLRSQVLAQLYCEVQRGELERKAARVRLDHLRSLQIRLLGDRSSQDVAWRMAVEAGWQDTFFAEYVALTKLQADALAVENADLARMASKLVPVATYEELLSWMPSQQPHYVARPPGLVGRIPGCRHAASIRPSTRANSMPSPSRTRH
jgi:predicted nucleic acid-binding protein